MQFLAMSYNPGMKLSKPAAIVPGWGGYLPLMVFSSFFFGGRLSSSISIAYKENEVYISLSYLGGLHHLILNTNHIQ